ncbi:MAG: hypothetical protein DYG98_27550 [Haliscomenobacteraceae bacterium CHB4]|nr:hypothetical protein [Saprospiraceae bacterium]MCE7926811.1 hypothetical protein [Haliscomenobacteraceae bacterium CHB4]
MKDTQRCFLFLPLLSFTLLFFCTNSVKIMHAERVTWPFHDLLSGVEYPDVLLGLEPAAELDTTQPAGTIGFSLVLKNRNNTAVTLPNPVDHLQYMLLDSQEYPLPSPLVMSRVKLSPEDWDSWVNPFCPLVEVSKNGTPLPVAEIQRLRSIELAASDTYVFSFQIKGTPKADAGTEITPLSPGRYSLLLTYSLFLNTVPPLPNRLLQTDKIPIHLQ